MKKQEKLYDFVSKELLKISNDNGDNLNAWIMKPKDFDSTKTYPVLMYVYGGPRSNTVENSYGGGHYLWFQYMVDQGYIIVSVDGRGTGGRGEDFAKCTYRQLGKYETEDQIQVALRLAKLSYVDKHRIGVFGWSFGGYLSSLCIMLGADVFKLAIAVAPVTNWRWYDTIYTERFLGLPKDNAKGYDSNSPIQHVDKLKGKYMIVTGLVDDNVHPQNTFELVNALVENNKAFDMMVYPNRNHSIYGGNARLHLYNRLTNYILSNL